MLFKNPDWLIKQILSKWSGFWKASPKGFKPQRMVSLCYETAIEKKWVVMPPTLPSNMSVCASFG